MFYLGETIGKQTAHSIVYEASMDAIETNQPLIDLLMDHNEISGKFRREDLEKTIDPANHIGLSKKLTRRVIDYVRQQLSHMEPIDETIRTCPLSDKHGLCTV